MSKGYKKIYDGVREEVLSAEEIQKRVRELAKEICDYYLPEEVCIMPVLTSGMIFASALIFHLKIPVRVFPVISTKDKGTTIYTSPGHELPKKLLVVDAMIDTGKTLYRVGDQLGYTDVSGIDICTLIHRAKVAQDDLPVRFVGFTLRQSDHLVGFGLDYHGYFRNLPSVYKYKPK